MTVDTEVHSDSDVKRDIVRSICASCIHIKMFSDDNTSTYFPNKLIPNILCSSFKVRFKFLPTSAILTKASLPFLTEELDKTYCSGWERVAELYRDDER